ncbi:MAG TPA: hypothetical protein VNB24_08245 [Acidimicrobiales bacterium]|nr:hypothetical protein [Acidimicrobiales bacterium]
MDVTKTLRDATYIAIGLGVIGFQRAQVRRQELRSQLADQKTVLDARATEARALVSELVKQADSRIEPVIAAVEAQIDAVADLLPEQTKGFVTQARTAGKEVRSQLRARVAA